MATTILPDNTSATTTKEEPKLLPADHAAFPHVPDAENGATGEAAYTVTIKERPADADSFIVANNESIVFPDSLAQDLNIKTAMSDDVSKILKELVCGGLGAVPYVGKLLGGLLGFLWPKPDDRMQTMKAFEEIARSLAKDMIYTNNAKDLLHKVQGAYNALKSYSDEALGTKNKGYTFSNLKSHLETMEPAFLGDDSPWYSMPYFSAMGTLYLSVLREEALFYEQIYGEPDKIHDARVQRLADTVPWREGTWWDGWAKCRVRDERRQIEVLFFWDSTSQNCNAADAYVELLREWVDTTYAAEVDEKMIGAANLWDLYHPSWLRPRHERMQRLAMNYIRRGAVKPFGKWNSNFSRFDDREMFVKHGPITKIVLHGSRTMYGHLIEDPNVTGNGREQFFTCGLEVFYGGQSSGIRGRRAVGEEPTRTLEIDTVSEVIAYILIERYVERESAAHGIGDHVWYLSITKYGPDGAKENIACGSRPPGMGESFSGYNSYKNPNPTKEIERLLWFSGWQDIGQGAISFLTPHFGSYQQDEALGPKGGFW